MPELKALINSLIKKNRTLEDFSILTSENSLNIIYEFLEKLQSDKSIIYNPYGSGYTGEAIFLEAPTGSGKDTLFRQLSEQNKEKKYVELNMDMFRNNYMAFIPNLDSLNDIDFAKQTNQFSYAIFLLIQELLLEYFPGTNVVISGTLRETDWIEKLMIKYKTDLKTKYTLKLITMAITEKEGLYSVIKRYVDMVDEKKELKIDTPSRYTSSEYYYETFEKFLHNFGYFISIFESSSQNLIDSVEVYRRTTTPDSFVDNNLVYSSKHKSYQYYNAISAVTDLRKKPYKIPVSDAIDTVSKIKGNLDHFQKQGTLADILYSLAPIVKNYKPDTSLKQSGLNR